MPMLKTLLLTVLLAPLLGSLMVGFLGSRLNRTAVAWVTTGLVGVSLAISVLLYRQYFIQNLQPFNQNLMIWASVGHLQLNIGLLVDRLTVQMLLVVNFISFLVHIYSAGYMEEDEGFARFFSYISGFTFAMLVLVMANNFLLLFFGWEAVGLVSYLLIGFWFEKESASAASLKAFLVNRIGDLGLLLGIAGVLASFGTLDYAEVFAKLSASQALPGLMPQGVHMDSITAICVCLLLGAFGKSAQMPLHVWLEGSMEGPTPISALIHAATMVTAGVFMLARLSPLFEYSEFALSVTLVMGSLTCLLMGILGIVQFDIKRVIAYSTLSQLGYMVAAQGASAFELGIFHLSTHAMFKALLFLSAGSVIVALHHQQDMRQMGGLWKRMPITCLTTWIGALSLVAIPPFAGFFSKDLIIEAVQKTTIPGHALAAFCVTAGAFVTAVYTFRLVLMVFHGKTRLSLEDFAHVKEPSWTLLVPLLVLSVPAIFLGIFLFEPVLHGFLKGAVVVLPKYDLMPSIFSGSAATFMVEATRSLPFGLTILGGLFAWVFYVGCPSFPARLVALCPRVYQFLVRKYWIDEAYEVIFVGGARLLGWLCWQLGDLFIIDNGLVNGSARCVQRMGARLRQLQTGFLYHYALAMVVGLGLMMIFSYAFY